jgi:preprotein translocase subunit SecF
MQVFLNTNYDFLKWRWRAVALSVVIMLIGLGIFLTRGANVGIDFAGGANVILRFQESVPVDQLRATISDATIQQYGKPEENSVLLRLPQAKGEGDYAGQVVKLLNQRLNGDLGSRLDLNFQGRDAIAETLKAKDPDRKGAAEDAHNYYYGVAQNVVARRSELGIFRSMGDIKGTPGLTPAAATVLEQSAVLGKFNVLSQETVGPQVGSELQRKAMFAIIFSILAMGIYIAIRFDLKFGVAAIICLIHDILIGLAFLMMINGEFEIITVAALLMIVGYSINDAVVVYDRVRENMRKVKVKDNLFEEVLNRSLNQTLSRTVLTGGSVMLVLISLILFGGEVINEFAWLLLIGTIAGTYSTLTVVPAVVVWWNRRQMANHGRSNVTPVRNAPVDDTQRKRAKA